jgi:hypothetical protein
VVAGDVEKGHVEAAHEVLEVVERQVTAAEDQVGVQAPQPVAVQRLLDLVGDREDARRRASRRA